MATVVKLRDMSKPNSSNEFLAEVSTEELRARIRRVECRILTEGLTGENQVLDHLCAELGTREEC